jgi:hypothetical protein
MPRPLASPATGAFLWEGKMAFRRVHTNYDRSTGRAYVELRAPDSDDGEIIVTAIFTYRTIQKLSNADIEKEVRRKAAHAFNGAAKAE